MADCMADNFCLDTKTRRNPDSLVCSCTGDVNFHPVSHIEHLEHLFPPGSRDSLNCGEQRWNVEQVVLDVMHAVAEPQALCLRATGTVNDTFNRIPQRFS